MGMLRVSCRVVRVDPDRDVTVTLGRDASQRRIVMRRLNIGGYPVHFRGAFCRTDLGAVKALRK